MNDRLMNGFIAGIISGVVAMLADWLLIDIFGFGSLHFSDFSGYFILGAPPQNTPEYLFSYVGALLFLGVMGIIFNFMVKKDSKYFVFKTVLYAESVWFFLYALTLLFRVPYLSRIPLDAAIENSIVDFIYGISLGNTLIWLYNRQRART